MTTESEDWTPEGHLNLLLTEGDLIACDSGKLSEIKLELPPWFDVEKFNSGQKYYKDNILSLFVGMLCGLVAILAVPSILRVLVFTGKSSTPKTAYRRYIPTFLHTISWFVLDLTKDTSSWKSLAMVRKRHLSSSQSASRHGVGQISQKDMVLTQFALMGYMISRPKYLGLLHTTKEEREGFVHFWRCIGYILGIKDRFNLCARSLEDTEALCDLLIESQFRTHLSMKNATFEDQSGVLLSAAWTFIPFIDYDAFMYFLKRLTGVENYHYFPSDLPKTPHESYNASNTEETTMSRNFQMSPQFKKMHWYSKFILWLMIMVLQVLTRYRFLRWWLNLNIVISLFFIQYFPFLGFHRFGFKASYIDIGIHN